MSDSAFRYQDVVLDNQPPFYAGSWIKGHVLVDLHEPVEVKGVNLHFTGSTSVEWVEFESRKNQSNVSSTTRMHTYKAHEEHLNHVLRLHEICQETRQMDNVLSNGVHTFAFNYQLPADLPSSLDGAQGRVAYEMTSTVRMPQRDHQLTVPFKVISVVDLNATPDVQLGLQGENAKTLCCLCCASGPVTATFSLPRSGYVPGETIQLFANISNQSDKPMEASYVTLTMTTDFMAGRRKTSRDRELVRIDHSSIPPGQVDEWAGEPLVIPLDIPPTHLPGCNIIDVRYVLKMTIVPPGPSFNLEIPLDLLIATIPLRSEAEMAAIGTPPGEQ